MSLTHNRFTGRFEIDKAVENYLVTLGHPPSALYLTASQFEKIREDSRVTVNDDVMTFNWPRFKADIPISIVEIEKSDGLKAYRKRIRRDADIFRNLENFLK